MIFSRKNVQLKLYNPGKVVHVKKGTSQEIARTRREKLKNICKKYHSNGSLTRSNAFAPVPVSYYPKCVSDKTAPLCH
jgi:hypothetical protein